MASVCASGASPLLPLPVLLGGGVRSGATSAATRGAGAAPKIPVAALFPTASLPKAALRSEKSPAAKTPQGIIARRTVRRKNMILDHADGARQLHDVYDIEEHPLGEGCFGTVFRARLRSDPEIVRAVKVVQKINLRAEKVVRKEVKVLRHLDHPRICRLFETFEDDWSIYLVLEFIEGRELFDELIERDRLDERTTALVMQQILGALAYCHERNILHRDLKPENIMVVAPTGNTGVDDPLQMKLIDFGLAEITVSHRGARAGSSIDGSAEYISPEARRGIYLSASDMWSMGIVMHVLLMGDFPSNDALVGREDMVFTSSTYQALSPAAIGVLSGLTRIDPKQRFTALEALSHPWICCANNVPTRLHDLTPTVKALTEFHRCSRLRRAAITAVATQLTGRQMDNLQAQFLLMDTNGDGRISKQEFVKGIAILAPGDSDNAECWAAELFDSVDTDGSEEIEYTEWLAAAVHESAWRSDQAVHAAFQMFDHDGDGRIDASELARVLPQSPEEATALLKEFDTNDDGVLDLAEFTRVLTGTVVGAL
eukprot:TRINITY_DN23573_c0_g1_i1.p1 TRINITY_DN23573_c0_g1~~TRINITY_DN23573_c0_g1_i1.p1  ORF type:complete len:574 (+),score=92.20 TRINITY_DN23573_c0_g1_i1:94-1722(+)